MKGLFLACVAASCLSVVSSKFYRNSGPRGPLERFRVLISYRDQPPKDAQLPLVRGFEEPPLLSRLMRLDGSSVETSSESDVPRPRVAMKFRPYRWSPPL
ncbi:hypothetical protein AAVH_37534 [Aphelenchoides avenae]|nr:hypothetical protein AAVH_37534 [Aphelenchus avenae]